MLDQPPTVGVEADTALGKFKIFGADLNTFFTILSFIGLVLIGYVLYAHADDTRQTARAVGAELKEANKEIADRLEKANDRTFEVLKEMARATREQNCLLSLPQDKRERMAETCKRISQ